MQLDENLLRLTPTNINKPKDSVIMAKKTTTKKAAKKVAAKKAVKKVAAKKKSTKKAPAKKAAKKKVAAKKTPAKKVEKTSIIARVDVGFGNSLYVRGEGAGLSWDKGIQLDNVSPYEWTFESTQAKSDVTFKFLINDEIWAEGENGTVAPGETSISSPVFAW
jgi:ATPase subunit of ABC transporter with duplicated ATPase domains